MSDSIPRPDDGPAYGFPRRDCQRIARVIKQSESYYQNRQPQRGRWPTGSGPTLVPVFLNEALQPGGTSSPTSANCTVMVDSSPGPGFTTVGGRDDTIYNPYTVASIPSGKFCWGQYRNGFLYLFVGDC